MEQENVGIAPSTKRLKCLAVFKNTKRSFSSIYKINPLALATNLILFDSNV